MSLTLNLGRVVEGGAGYVRLPLDHIVGLSVCAKIELSIIYDPRCRLLSQSLPIDHVIGITSRCTIPFQCMLGDETKSGLGSV